MLTIVVGLFISASAFAGTWHCGQTVADEGLTVSMWDKLTGQGVGILVPLNQLSRDFIYEGKGCSKTCVYGDPAPSSRWAQFFLVKKAKCDPHPQD
jgi:hypothetical protein